MSYTIGEILDNKVVQVALELILVSIGFILLAAQAWGNIFNMGANEWNARVFGLLCIGLIALGFSLSGTDAQDKGYRFFIVFGIMTIIWFIFGGVLVANDTLNDTDYSGGNLWVSFDSLGNVAEWAAIRDFVVYSVPAGILIATVVMLFYVDSTEISEVVIEGALSFGFTILYAWIMSNFFGF